VIDAYTDDFLYCVKVGASSSPASTLNLNSTGTKTVIGAPGMVLEQDGIEGTGLSIFVLPGLSQSQARRRRNGSTSIEPRLDQGRICFDRLDRSRADPKA